VLRPIIGIAVESTYNWYWLVDGLEDAGFTVLLVNNPAVKQHLYGTAAIVSLWCW
jgi:hypothetical protein